MEEGFNEEDGEVEELHVCGDSLDIARSSIDPSNDKVKELMVKELMLSAGLAVDCKKSHAV